MAQAKRCLNQAQKLCLLKFMEDNPGFANGRIPSTPNNNKKLDDLALKLNEMPGGSIKTVAQWKEVWSRMRSNAKTHALSKGRPINGARTEDEPIEYTTGCNVTDRIMKLVGWDSVFGKAADEQVARRCASQSQKLAMLEFMEAHPDLGKGRIHAEQAHQVYNRLWEKLTNILNDKPDGSEKTVQQWKEVWGRMRSQAKMHALSNGKAKPTKTGGGGYSSGEEESGQPTSYTTDCDMTNRIMKFVGWHAVFGIGAVDELAISSDEGEDDQEPENHPTPSTEIEVEEEAILKLATSISRLCEAVKRLNRGTAALVHTIRK